MSPVLEQIALDTDQREAYEQTRSLLQTRATSLAPPFAVVPFQEGIESTSPSLLHSPPRTLWMQNDVSMPSLLIVGRTQLLQEALQQLEGLEKQEAMLFERSPLTRELTSIITNEEYDDAPQALERLVSLGKTVPRRVCQHPFRKNDIVWVCRTCQADETCVLCHACFTQSDHEGHDVNFYHAQAGVVVIAEIRMVRQQRGRRTCHALKGCMDGIPLFAFPLNITVAFPCLLLPPAVLSDSLVCSNAIFAPVFSFSRPD